MGRAEPGWEPVGETGSHVYRIAWGGRKWYLDPAVAGLRLEGAASGEASPWLLGLAGLAECGRCERDVFGPGSLMSVEHRFQRVAATYQPQGWGELTVRATWTPVAGGAAMDLEVQVNARSVGQLDTLEVLVESRWPATEAAEGAEPTSALRLQARDGEALSLTFDGRESASPPFDVAPLRADADPDAPLAPWEPRGPEASRAYYELAHPYDESRRLDGPESVRHALFGYDLERGVVLRGRIRGVWTRSGEEAARLFREFLTAPAPLTTG